MPCAAIVFGGLVVAVPARGEALAIAEGGPRHRLQVTVVHTVVVVDNFFSPAEITIDVGDTVRWNNAAGFHNVTSCNPTQLGCEGETASEVFGSGPGANGPWSYSYTFTQAGTNRYVCQPHAPFMGGRVTVRAPVTTPPAVPARGGAPLTIDRSGATDPRLILDWDSESCELALDHLVVYGTGDDLPDSPDGPFRIAGGVCGLGPDAPYAWENPPVAAPGQLIWWLVIASDGQQTEGSWGHNSSGERAGSGADGASDQCGVTVKSVANTCGLEP